MSRYFTSALAALEPYTPGEQPRDRRYIKLNTNESPYPAGPQVVKAVNADAVRDLRLYSDPACTGLVNAIAARCGVKPTQVTLPTAFTAYGQSSGACRTRSSPCGRTSP